MQIIGRQELSTGTKEAARAAHVPQLPVCACLMSDVGFDGFMRCRLHHFLLGSTTDMDQQERGWGGGEEGDGMGGGRETKI